MTLIELLILVLVAALCGSIGESIAGYSRGGILAKMGVGFIGAVIGSAVARGLGLPEIFAVRTGTTVFPVVWSIAGSALFVALLSLLARDRRYRTA
jgi:uncharacterized membrane protein YeaQ/YmgE (transglycosylase-associated protein family)